MLDIDSPARNTTTREHPLARLARVVPPPQLEAILANETMALDSAEVSMNWVPLVPSFFGAAAGAAAAIAVAFLVEPFRARVLGELWVGQERWKLKRDIYRELLEIQVQRITCWRQMERLFRDVDPDAPTPDDTVTEVNRVVSELNPLNARMRELRIGIARLWLRKETLDAIERGDGQVWEESEHHLFAVHTLKWLEEALELVLEEARQDLRLETRGA